MQKVISRLLLLTIVLSGCMGGVPISPQNTPTHMPITSVSPTLVTPPRPALTPTSTLTPVSTLTTDEIEREITTFLQTNGNCRFPCFWGIYPERTSQYQLDNFFAHLGKQGFASEHDNHIYKSSLFSFKNKLGIVEIQTDIQNGVVQNIKILLDSLWHKEIILQDWSAYNLSTILKLYGPPSSVDVYLDFPQNQILYDFRLTYKNLDAAFFFIGVAKPQTSLDMVRVCPDTKEVTAVEMWFGKNPINAEPTGIPLSSAALLSLEEFAEVFEQDSQSACLTLRVDAFSR